MKISTKSFLAIEALMDVALLGLLKPVTLTEIGRYRHASLSRLEQIFRRLREHGLVTSTRGPGGGYRLNCRLSAISVADIIGMVDNPPARVRATVAGRDGKGKHAVTHALWSGLDDHLDVYLRSVSLASLLDAAAAERIARLKTAQLQSPVVPSPQSAPGLPDGKTRLEVL